MNRSYSSFLTIIVIILMLPVLTFAANYEVVSKDKKDSCRFGLEYKNDLGKAIAWYGPAIYYRSFSSGGIGGRLETNIYDDRIGMGYVTGLVSLFVWRESPLANECSAFFGWQIGGGFAASKFLVGDFTEWNGIAEGFGGDIFFSSYLCIPIGGNCRVSRHHLSDYLVPDTFIFQFGYRLAYIPMKYTKDSIDIWSGNEYKKGDKYRNSHGIDNPLGTSGFPIGISLIWVLY